MIAVVRNNLSRIISTHDCRSPLTFSLYLHFFSTWKERQAATTHKVYDVLVHKHQFSPQVASLAASHLTEFRSSEKADLVLSFLEDCGFSSTQLEEIVNYKPRILSHTVEDIQLKIKILQDLGLSSEDITKMIYHNKMILHLSAKNNIVPTLSLLKGLLGSDYDVARLLRKSAWFLLSDLKTNLLPNVELLKSRGIPMERILYFLYTYPRSILMKPDIIRKAVDKANEMGFSENSSMFVHAIQVISSLSEGMWDVKLQAFRGLGFSDSDTLTMFKKAPRVFATSIKKVEGIKELLLATGKFDMSSIVNNPTSLTCSIENRYKPRLRVLEILESKNLIGSWPRLGTFYTLSDDRFSKRFIRPYLNEVGQAFDTKGYLEDKRDSKSVGAK